jgi:DEAD/DEAH box helicase domain-containing protein
MTITPSVGLPATPMAWRRQPAGAMARAAPSSSVCRVTILCRRSRLPGVRQPPRSCALAPGTLCAIPITKDLNGSRRQFGQRAWQRVFDAVPQLQQQLVGNQPLAALHYSDRYLRSPLTVVLIRALLGALADFPGGVVADTQCAIATSALQRNDTQEPRWLHHDWQDATDRRQVFEQIFDGLGKFALSEAWHAQLPHARELRLTWMDGAVWTMRLDQGVGYWRACNYREPRL